MDRPLQSVKLTPFDPNWKKGSGATPLTIQDLFCGGEISIPTALTLKKKSGQNDREEHDRAYYGAVCGHAKSDLLSASATDCSICCKSFFI